MTNEFLSAYDKLIDNEGYLSNNPNDRGGLTWKGIARNMHPNWKGWITIDMYLDEKAPISKIKSDIKLEKLVQQFYYTEFWKKLRLDEVTKEAVRNKFFDTAVNVGIVPAIRFNQTSVGLPTTGKITDELINKLNSLG